MIGGLLVQIPASVFEPQQVKELFGPLDLDLDLDHYRDLKELLAAPCSRLRDARSSSHPIKAATDSLHQVDQNKWTRPRGTNVSTT